MAAVFQSRAGGVLKAITRQYRDVYVISVLVKNLLSKLVSSPLSITAALSQFLFFVMYVSYVVHKWFLRRHCRIIIGLPSIFALSME